MQSCISLVASRDSHLIHLGSGGLAHMLRLLGNTIHYCQHNNLQCVPILEKNRAFGLAFHDVFETDTSTIANAQTCENLSSVTIRDGTSALPLADARVIYSGPSGGGEYFLSNGKGIWSQLSLNLDAPPAFSPCSITTGSYRSRTQLTAAGWRATLSMCRLKRHIAEQIGSKRQLLSGRYIGVHYRNTDMRTDFSLICQHLQKQLIQTDVTCIYWATDDLHSLALAKSHFPNTDILNFATLPDLQETGTPSLHYTGEKHLKAIGMSKRQQIIEAFTDIFLLSHSDTFIPSPKSSLSRLVNLLRSEHSLRSHFFAETHSKSS